MTTDPYDVVAAADTSYPDAQITHSGYDAIVSGDTTGWSLGQATSSTVQMGASASAADLVAYTRYDSAGRTIQSRLPGDATGTTARTTDAVYYTHGTGACASDIWAGMVCSTGPAAQPGTGNPLPSTAYTYTQYGNQLTKTETYGTSGTVRTSTTSYDTAGRAVTDSITVIPTLAGGTALPTVTTGYDSATGLATTTSTGTSGSAVTLTTGYDTLGRVVSYTDASGAISTTTYDLAGNVAVVTDPKGTTTYTYDDAISEHRGLVTGQDIGVSGALSTFSASYDAAGKLTTQTYPNGLAASTSYDNAGNATKLVYAKGGSTWMTFTATPGGGERTVAQTGPQSSQRFGYDPAGRLTSVQDTAGGVCTTRTYSFDSHSNRTALNSYPAGGGGVCSMSTTPTVTGSSFDQADRITTPGYSYDTLGRTSTVPSVDAQGIGSHAATTGSLAVGYYSNDMVATQTQGAATVAFTLDPLQNRIHTSSDGTTTLTNHYTGNSDSPGWTSTGPTVWTRNLTGPDGNLAATTDQSGTVTLHLVNLHGDIIATAPDTTVAIGVATYSEATEYGAPRTPAAAPDTYGWLGAKQRSSNALGGVILMGVRLYNPLTGRFLTTDPVPGGNANAYIYPQDPINGSDISGECGLFGNPFTPCRHSVSGKTAKFCANVGCITYQVSPAGYLQIGIPIYGGYRGIFTNIEIFKNGKRLNLVRTYAKGLYHTSLPPWMWRNGDSFSVSAQYHYPCFFGFATCTARSVPNTFRPTK